MKIIHWGKDYATLKIGKKEFKISISLGEAIKAQNKRNMERLNRIDEYACEAVRDNDNGEAQELERDYKYLSSQFSK